MLDTAGGFQDAMAKTGARLGVMPQEVLRRIYLKPGSLLLEEKGDEDPNSAVVTYVESLPPFNDPTVGFLSNAVRRLVGAANAERVLKHALLHRATPFARGDMTLDFEAAAIRLIAEGRTFCIMALPVAFKPKGSEKGTWGACTSGGHAWDGDAPGPLVAHSVSAAGVHAWVVHGVVVLALWMWM